MNTIDSTAQNANNLSQEAKTFYDKTLLQRLIPTLVFAKYGQKKSIPTKSGKSIEFRKFASLDPANSPLTEGVTPVGKNLSVTAITATVEQYGDYVEISDMLDLVGIDPVLTETAELLGEQAGLTLDNVTRDIVCAGTNVQFAGGKAGTNEITSNDKISYDEVAKAVATLKKGNVKGIEGKFYIGIIDPDLSYDLQKDPLFQDVSKYNGGQALMEGEVGKLGRVRFIETTETLVKPGEILSYEETADENVVEGKTYYTKSGSDYLEASITSFASGTTYYEAVRRNVHCAMIIGKDAYGIVDVNGKSKPENIVKPFGSAGTADPLNQRSTSGWKAVFTAKRLDENAMVRLECATTLD